MYVLKGAKGIFTLNELKEMRSEMKRTTPSEETAEQKIRRARSVIQNAELKRALSAAALRRKAQSFIG